MARLVLRDILPTLGKPFTVEGRSFVRYRMELADGPWGDSKALAVRLAKVRAADSDWETVGVVEAVRQDDDSYLIELEVR